MTDPGQGNVQIRMRRRRTRRHRSNQRIRRGLVAAMAMLVTAGASSLALHYLAPSLFRSAGRGAPPFQQAEVSRHHRVDVNQEAAHRAPSADRPVYPYSVVAGGVEDARELKWFAEHDPVVAAHYAGFDYDHARVVRLTLARTAYVSYRIGNQIYWMRRRVTLHKGEKLLTDGKITARTRCGNRVEEAPQQAASASEPPAEKFEQPARVSEGTAVQFPPSPFQSALLNRPPIPGAEPEAPLSLLNPFVGGNPVPFAPPPLPVLGVCEPVPPKKKDGNSSIAGVVAMSGTTTKKKGGTACGAAGIVPEPGTWLLFASGLAAIGLLARRKFASV